MAEPKIVSFSELTSARRCSFRHQAAYVERWSKPQDGMSALGKGIAWHTVLETHYNVILDAQRKSVTDRAKIEARCRTRVNEFIGTLPEELAELISWMYEGHLAVYGTDPEWEILAVEHSGQVRLPTVAGRPSMFVLKMKIDLIVRERSSRRIRVIDHKSGKDLPHKKSLEIDDQFPLYVWGLNHLGRNVFGATYNAARTLRLKADIIEPGSQPLDERFSRTPIYHTPKELNQIALEAFLTARTRYQEQRQVSRAGVDPPRSTDTLRCQWDCDFYAACLAGRKGVDWRSYLRSTGFAQDFERH